MSDAKTAEELEREAVEYFYACMARPKYEAVIMMINVYSYLKMKGLMDEWAAIMPTLCAASKACLEHAGAVFEE